MEDQTCSPAQVAARDEYETIVKLYLPTRFLENEKLPYYRRCKLQRLFL